jgi:phosphate transport system protein
MENTMYATQSNKLEKLEHKILDFFSHIDMMVVKLKTGIKERNTSLLVDLIEKDEKKANKTELRIDQYALIFIAKYEPKARSLRSAITSIKINNTLERIADHSVNISRHTIELINSSFVNYFNDNLIYMLDVTHQMLIDTKAAIENDDIDLAQSIQKRDLEVNKLRDVILQNCILEISKNGQLIKDLDHLIAMSRNIERIADLTTNICEDLIYKIDGKITKHHKN